MSRAGVAARSHASGEAAVAALAEETGRAMGLGIFGSPSFVVDGEGLCCTNPVWDSSHESSVVAGIHEQTYTPDLQDQELASLQ